MTVSSKTKFEFEIGAVLQSVNLIRAIEILLVDSLREEVEELKKRIKFLEHRHDAEIMKKIG